jgi:O-antigen ligase
MRDLVGRAEPEDRTQAALFWGALFLVVVATLFGGASRTNALSLMGVELASLPLLFVSLYMVLGGAAPKTAALPLVLLGVVVLVAVLNVVPLPYSIWTRLPNRSVLAQSLNIVRAGRAAEPFTMVPEEGWRCFLALAPPVAMFCGVLFLTDAQRRVMVGVWLALAVAGVVTGIAQLVGGLHSPLYFYSFTNWGSPVGFFANRNHQAAFLYALIPLAAISATHLRGSLESSRSLFSWLALLYVLIAIVGVAATRSRAGVFLVGVSIIIAGALSLRMGFMRQRWRAALAFGAVSAAGLLAVLIFGIDPILERFNSTREARFLGWPLVVQAARSYLPLGSGLGSFSLTYEGLEPLGYVGPTYFNHAHNEYLELWLETGVVGAALIAAFAAWLIVASARVWTSPEFSRAYASRRGSAGGGAAALPAACAGMLWLLLAHSAVDYPLRTETIAVLFAFGCANLAAYKRPPRLTAPAAEDLEKRRKRVKVRVKLDSEAAPVGRAGASG